MSHRTNRVLRLLCLFALAYPLPSVGQEVIPHRQDKPPNQPYAPSDFNKT